MTLESNVYWAMVIMLGCNTLVCVLATWRARRNRETWTAEDTLFCLSLILTGAVMVFFRSFVEWVEWKPDDRDQA